jgi:hypothetical protein
MDSTRGSVLPSGGQPGTQHRRTPSCSSSEGGPSGRVSRLEPGQDQEHITRSEGKQALLFSLCIIFSNNQLLKVLETDSNFLVSYYKYLATNYKI